jgi:hypothetical protein
MNHFKSNYDYRLCDICYNEKAIDFFKGKYICRKCLIADCSETNCEKDDKMAKIQKNIILKADALIQKKRKEKREKDDQIMAKYLLDHKIENLVLKYKELEKIAKDLDWTIGRVNTSINRIFEQIRQEKNRIK